MAGGGASVDPAGTRLPRRGGASIIAGRRRTVHRPSRESRLRTLIRHASVVLPTGPEPLDVLLDGGRLRLSPPSTVKRDATVDAAGKLLFPGVVDDQVHFREPGLTHKEDLATGSRACAAGGVTTFLEMPNTDPSTVSRKRWREKNDLAATKSLVNWGFYLGATPDNVGELRKADAGAVPGIKIFIGSSTGDLLVDEQEALERIFAETTLPICAHCEDEATVRANRVRAVENHGPPPWPVAVHSEVRDVNAAVVSVRRATDLARKYRHRFHVLHVSTAAELTLLRDHAGLLTGEACPHHLFFHLDDYGRLGTRVQMNPSIKSASDNAALWRALHEGTLQVVATDHAPHTLEEKARPYPESPSGLPAVENSLALLLNAAAAGRCTHAEIASWMSDAPARVWGLVGKGRIAEGYDADVCLVDPEERWTVRDADQHAKSRWSPWDGETLTGRVTHTWVGGRAVFADGTLDDTIRGEAVRCDHDRGGYHATPDGIGPRDAVRHGLD